MTAAPETLPASMRHLPASLAEAFRNCGRRLAYPRGALLHGQGDPADGFYLVTRGRVRIGTVTEAGRELVVTDMEPGDLFGDISLLDGLPRTHDAICVEETEALRLSPADFDAMLEAHPELYRFFVRTLALKLRMCFGVMSDAALLSAPQRLAKRLLWLSGAVGPRARERGPRPIVVHQGDLALMVGSSRQTVNRELKAWERSGIVEQTDAGILVRDTEALAKIATG